MSVKILYSALLFLFISLAGCTTVDSYGGSKQPDASVAIIKGVVSWLSITPVSVEIRKVDGIKVSRFAHSVRVLPGLHTLELACQLEVDGVRRVAYAELEMVTQAEGVYQLYRIPKGGECVVGYE